MALFRHSCYIIGTLMLILLPTAMSWDPNKPCPDVKTLCSTAKNYSWCIDSLNNGATEEADMHYLSIFTRDLAEGNVTWGIDYLNKTLVPNEEDPYVHEVMLACLDAFVKVKDVLVNKLDNYIFESKYQEAKPWGMYALSVINSCEIVCTAKRDMKCPLFKDIYGSKDAIKLMNNAITFITDGVV